MLFFKRYLTELCQPVAIHIAQKAEHWQFKPDFLCSTPGQETYTIVELFSVSMIYLPINMIQ